MDPAALDLASVPRIAHAAMTVGTGPELLVVDVEADRTHLLSPTAALAWVSIDGHSTIGDLAGAVAADLGADAGTVRSDVLALCTDLARRGLLDVGPEPAPAVRAEPERRLVAPVNEAIDARFRPGTARFVEVGAVDLRFGVRVDQPAPADALAAGLATAGILADGPRAWPQGEASPLYSLLGHHREGPVERLAFLYRSSRLRRRTRHDDRLVAIALADITALVDREVHGEPLLDAIGLVRGDDLLVVDPALARMVDDDERRLAAAGIDRLEPSFVGVGPLVGRRVVGLLLRPWPQPDLSPAEVALSALDLARGADGRVGPDALGQLMDLTATVPIRRVASRTDLRAEVAALLP